MGPAYYGGDARAEEVGNSWFLSGTAKRSEGANKIMSIQDAALKHAIEWMSDRLKEEPNAKRAELIDQASREFGLTSL